MRRYLLVLAVLLLSLGTASAQRYLPRQMGIEVSGGFVDGFKVKKQGGQAFYGNIGMSMYNKRGDRWSYGVEYLQKQLAYRDTLLPVSQFTAEGGYYLKLVSDPSKTLFLSLGGSALLGYETINWGDRTLYDGAIIKGKDKFIIGGALSLELETFITDRVIFLVMARERVMFRSSLSKFHFQLGAGIKIIIN